MKNIRVTYSGFISLLVGFSSIITGTIFTLIVTRQLSQEEFGTWSLIGSLIGYTMVTSPIITFWSTREIARGIDSAKTAIFAAMLFSAIAMIVYVILAFVVGDNTGVNPLVLLFAIILIPLMFLNRILTAIMIASKPHVQAYGLFVYETAKIPVAFLLVYIFEMGLEGAIITTAIAYVPSIVILGYHSKEFIIGKIRFQTIKKWVKHSWVPAINQSITFLATLDVLIFSVITGSVLGLAFWAAASAIANIVNHSGRISVALYPKLLEGGKEEYVSQSMSWLFYFGIPLVAFAIIFAKPGLFVLNPLYENAFPIVIFLSIRIFAESFLRLCSNALIGTEKVDTKNSTFNEYVKSQLFKAPMIRIIQYSTYVISLIIILTIFIDSPDLELVTYWAFIILAVQIPFTIYFYILLRKEFSINTQIKQISKYTLISIVVFGSVYLVMENYLEYKIEIFEFLPNLLIYAILSVLAYFGIVYFLDKKTRELLMKTINEIKGKN